MLREAYEFHTSTESSDQKPNKQKCGDFTYQLECSRALLHLESLELVSEQASNQLHTRLDSLTMDTTDNDNLLEAIWTNLNLDEVENDDNDDEYDVDNHDLSTAANRISPTYNSYASIMKKFKTKLPNDYNLDKDDESDQQLPENLSSRTVQLWCKITETSDCLNSIYPNGRFLEILFNRVITNILNGKDFYSIYTSTKTSVSEDHATFMKNVTEDYIGFSTGFHSEPHLIASQTTELHSF
ncbi:unnamed protein product [Schistosoma mattheei]|uniref:Uncharacterized protein n=1 Tax=Schistosoma mattheei TaxID=31246 RepID=A0A3P8G0S3_9TREM|nr:unnamed protein product [Schistosoma mattheei]